MTLAIITAAFLLLVGFIAGALWERGRNGRHIRSVLDRAKKRALAIAHETDLQKERDRRVEHVQKNRELNEVNQMLQKRSDAAESALAEARATIELVKRLAEVSEALPLVGRTPLSLGILEAVGAAKP